MHAIRKFRIWNVFFSPFCGSNFPLPLSCEALGRRFRFLLLQKSTIHVNQIQRGCGYCRVKRKTRRGGDKERKYFLRFFRHLLPPGHLRFIGLCLPSLSSTAQDSGQSFLKSGPHFLWKRFLFRLFLWTIMSCKCVASVLTWSEQRVAAIEITGVRKEST